MKLVISLVAIAALAVGCKKTSAPEPGTPPPSTKPSNEKLGVPPGAGQTAPSVTSTPPAPQATPEAQPGDHAGVTASGLPKECDDYKAAIDKLTSCSKLAPAAKDSIVQAYQAASAGWAKLPEDSRKNLGATCKAGVDSVYAAAKTQCGW